MIVLSNKRRSAFTLIELLIVVAIIAILAAIAVPNFLEAQTRAKVSKVKSDMRSLTTALEAYYVDHNNYVPGGVCVGGWGIAEPDKSYTAHRPDTYNGNDTTSGGFFFMLSTPVAYIANSFIDDPFGKVEGNLSSDDYLKRYVRYTTGNSETFLGHWGDFFDDGASHPDRVHTPGNFLNYNGSQGRFPGGTGVDGSDNYGGTQIQWWTLWSVGPDQETGVFAEIAEHPGTAPDTWKLSYLDVGDLATGRGMQGPFQQMFIHEFNSGEDGYTNVHPVPENAEIIISQFLYDPTNGSKSQGNIYRTGGVNYGQADIGLTHRYGGNWWLFANALSNLTD